MNGRATVRTGHVSGRAHGWGSERAIVATRPGQVPDVVSIGMDWAGAMFARIGRPRRLFDRGSQVGWSLTVRLMRKVKGELETGSAAGELQCYLLGIWGPW